MATTNHERVGKALELLKNGLAPFVEREVQRSVKGGALNRHYLEDPMLANKSIGEWDVSALLKLMWDVWNDVFKNILGHAERSLVSELREWRNRWAHQATFSGDDTYRALDSAGRMLIAVSSNQAEEVERMKAELLRLRYDEQVRGEKRKAGGSLIEGAASGALKPWREVVSPHPDVASGRYQQAEFAADLWQVYLGEGSDEYKNPKEFFRRTYLTESLKRLLSGAVRRLSGKGGDPVVQLQTNFGGGKTHSMLALFHLFCGSTPNELLGIEAVMQDAEIDKLPSPVRRVVIVGNRISPGNPARKPDGTVVRTLWGELAWQLGFAAGGEKEAKKAFERVREDDERATSPGDVMQRLFNDYGPCLILIDEWVAYARQLHDAFDLPGGSFETQFTFAQALTETAKSARHCLVVISLPASDTGTSPQAHGEDVEVGGSRGREALERLRNVVGRVESAWRPASAEESFEIVRRRLFQDLSDQEHYKSRDVTARAFADFYRSQPQEFPPECREAGYEGRIKAAYPIHPEIFDRLYTDWSTLLNFQRTRGVLRLMATVIHCLWVNGDKNPLILPAGVPIDDARVQFELTRYLSDNWVPVIEKDVDGASALPVKLDGELPNLGKFSACRRVARTIYMGSAPTTAAAKHGIEDRRIKLGCLMPGEPPSTFGDALRRLAGAATYLYQDGPRYWYSTQPTVTKLAEDRAEQLKREPDKVASEIERRIRDDLRNNGGFAGVHPFPQSGSDVSDGMETRLVALGAEYPYSKEQDNKALVAAKAILESCGSKPRLYRNTLVFLAADRARMEDIEDAVRKYLAWDSVLGDKESLDLSSNQVRQAENQKTAAGRTVDARVLETYQWLLVPTQTNPQSPVEWQWLRLSGQEQLALRASKKLKADELLVTSLGPSRLRMEMDRVPLWRGDHVQTRQLEEDFARYLYLPRLKDLSVLQATVRDSIGLLTWESDAFAYAESYDEDKMRYRGLRVGGKLHMLPTESGLLVKPDVAKRQMNAEAAPTSDTDKPDIDKTKADGDSPLTSGGDKGAIPKANNTLRRFHGTVTLDPARTGRDASRIAEEVIVHLLGLVGAQVRVTLEIEAEIPSGATDQVVRTVTENSRTLNFKGFGFEKE